MPMEGSLLSWPVFFFFGRSYSGRKVWCFTSLLPANAGRSRGKGPKYRRKKVQPAAGQIPAARARVAVASCCRFFPGGWPSVGSVLPFGSISGAGKNDGGVGNKVSWKGCSRRGTPRSNLLLGRSELPAALLKPADADPHRLRIDMVEIHPVLLDKGGAFPLVEAFDGG